MSCLGVLDRKERDRDEIGLVEREKKEYKY